MSVLVDSNCVLYLSAAYRTVFETFAAPKTCCVVFTREVKSISIIFNTNDA